MKKFRYVFIIGMILLDQAVKLLIRGTMYVGESISVIGNFFAITYVQNRGAAFSLFTGKGIFLTVVPFAALLAAIWYMERHRSAHFTLSLALQLIIAGGFANLIDRVALGYVTDMFDFRVWPVFNIADICICVGCAVLVLYIFVFDKTQQGPAETKTGAKNEPGKNL